MADRFEHISEYSDLSQYVDAGLPDAFESGIASEKDLSASLFSRELKVTSDNPDTSASVEAANQHGGINLSVRAVEDVAHDATSSLHLIGTGTAAHSFASKSSFKTNIDKPGDIREGIQDFTPQLNPLASNVSTASEAGKVASRSFTRKMLASAGSIGALGKNKIDDAFTGSNEEIEEDIINETRDTNTARREIKNFSQAHKEKVAAKAAEKAKGIESSICAREPNSINKVKEVSTYSPGQKMSASFRGIQAKRNTAVSLGTTHQKQTIVARVKNSFSTVVKSLGTNTSPITGMFITAVVAFTFLTVPLLLAGAAGGGAQSQQCGDGSKIIEIARQELNDGPHVGGEKYLKGYGLGIGTAWCGAFAGWCCEQAGLKPGENMTDWAPWAANHAAWYSQHPDTGTTYPNDGSYTPKPGDLAVRGDGENASWSDHIGIVDEVKGNLVYTIDGNWGNRISHHVEVIGSSAGYGWTHFASPNAVECSGGGAVSDLIGGIDWNMSKDEFIKHWGRKVNNFYSTYYPSAPLGGYGEVFAKYAYEYQVDPRFVAAISIVESTGGQFCWTSYNAWGWAAADGAYDYATGTFGSWENGIETVTRGLTRGYFEGLPDHLSIAKTYCSSWQAWYDNTKSLMEKIDKC